MYLVALLCLICLLVDPGRRPQLPESLVPVQRVWICHLLQFQAREFIAIEAHQQPLLNTAPLYSTPRGAAAFSTARACGVGDEPVQSLEELREIERTSGPKLEPVQVSQSSQVLSQHDRQAIVLGTASAVVTTRRNQMLLVHSVTPCCLRRRRNAWPGDAGMLPPDRPRGCRPGSDPEAAARNSGGRLTRGPRPKESPPGRRRPTRSTQDLRANSSHHPSHTADPGAGQGTRVPSQQASG